MYSFFFSQMLIGVSHIEPYGYISGHNIIIGWRKKEEKEKLKLQEFFSFYFFLLSMKEVDRIDIWKSLFGSLLRREGEVQSQ